MKNKEESWIKIMFGYAKGSKSKLYLSVLLSIISIISGIIPFYCMYFIISDFINGNTECINIIRNCGIGLIAFLVKVVCFGLSTGVSHVAAFEVLESLRKRVVERFVHAPLGAVQNLSIGDIKNVIVDKIEKVEPPLAHIVPEGSGHVVLPIVSFISLFIIDWRLALAGLITFPISIISMGLTYKISGKNFEKYNKSNTYMNSVIVEYVEGIEVIKNFGRTGSSYEKFYNAVTDYRNFVIKWMKSTWVTMKLAFAVFPATITGILPVGLWLFSKGEITTAEVALSVMLSISMVSSLAQLEVFSESIRQLKNTIFEIKKYLEIETLPEVTDKVDIKDYSIKLKNVSFSYSGEEKDNVLHGIDINVPQGEFTALVGPSGGGKSTIAKLIARFWDVTSGEILIGETNIKNIPLSQLSDYISYVSQDNYLLRTSILENIRIGNPNATDEEVMAAGKAAQCDEFISRLPQGYNTPAGEAGKSLSGGEKQRIAIARMILKNAPIVILDEATAFTDPENEFKIQQSIAELTKGKTLIVIAHRLSTIKNADNIVVLKNGNIVAQGKQEQLLESCELYKSMWESHIGAKNKSTLEQGEYRNV